VLKTDIVINAKILITEKLQFQRGVYLRAACELVTKYNRSE